MKRKFAVILAVMTAILLLAGCGAKATDGAMAVSPENNGFYGWDAVPEESEDALYDYDMEVEAPAEGGVYDEPAVPATGAEADISEVPEDYERKLIKNGSLDLETTEFDALISELEASVSTYGGYIQNSSSRGSSDSGDRYANYTVRIPASRYETFMNAVGDMGTVVSSNEYVDDVTLEYIDVEARLSALTAERDSFMKLMERAETVDEILQIQSYLTDVNYQIESYTSRLNSLKNQVSYSTINISVDEVRRVTPAAPKTVGERISQRLENSLYNIKEGAKDFFVGFVGSLPYLAIYAVVIVIIVVVITAVVKSRRRKKNARAASESEENENKK